MSICYPDSTDWSCAFTLEELDQMRGDPDQAALLEKAEAFAWYTLASLTAFQIGVCPTTIRPCAARCAPPGSWMSAPVGGGHTAALGPAVAIGRLSPYISGGQWFNACGCSPQDCSCSQLSEVVLPGPVGSIQSVYIDGEILPRSAYRVDNGNRLVRLDGEAWPACQDMTASDQDGFSVTYYRGAAPNLMTRAAAGRLAAEFYKSCAGDSCQLPDNIVRVSRGGESYEFEPLDFPEGKTGLREVDAVIRIYNPYGLRSAPTVTSPDVQRQRVATWR